VIEKLPIEGLLIIQIKRLFSTGYVMFDTVSKMGVLIEQHIARCMERLQYPIEREFLSFK